MQRRRLSKMGFWVGLITVFALQHLVPSAAAEPLGTGATDPGGSRCGASPCGMSLLSAEDHHFAAPAIDTDVKMMVSGMVVRVQVVHTFRNVTDEWVEGIYTFPLPVGAAVNELVMKIGNRVIRGEIAERQIAKKRYLMAKESGKTASLVNAERENIFTTKIANIGPQEEIRIELVYHAALDLKALNYTIRFPFVVGPRYMPSARMSDINRVQPPGIGNNAAMIGRSESLTNAPLIKEVSSRTNSVRMSVDLNLGVPLENINSRYHAIDIQRQGQTGYLVTLTQGSELADRDFLLEFAPQLSDVPKGVLLSEKFGDFHYGLMLLLPPQTNTVESIPREVTYIIDTSGSMGGTSIVAAREALKLALVKLQHNDRFNIIQFNSTSEALFPSPVEFNTEHIRLAESYVDNLQANGGTEMKSALDLAFRDSGSAEHLQQIIFITDGNVSNEAELFNIIETRLESKRLFTVGIGSAPNQFFMQRAAEYGRGTHTFIGKNDEVEMRMNALFAVLEKPVLREISLGVADDSLESWPQRIPDLYAGEPLAVMFRGKQLPGTLRITAKLPDRHWQAEVSVQGGQGRRGVAQLWANQKVAFLMREYRRTKQSQTRQAIVETAIEHRIASQFTSLIAVEEKPSNLKRIKNKTGTIPRHLPAGWQREKLTGSLPQTATNAPFYRALGVLLLSLAGFGAVNRRQRLNRTHRITC